MTIAPAGALNEATGDALVVLVSQQAATSGKTGLPAEIRTALAAALADGDFKSETGYCLLLRQPVGFSVPRLVLLGAGDGSARQVERALQAGVRELARRGVKRATVSLAALPVRDAGTVEAAVAAAAKASYRYTYLKSDVKPCSLTSLAFTGAPADALVHGLARGRAIAGGVAFAREWGNRPANHATPMLLADAARKLAKSHKLSIDILDHKDAEKLGMGALLAVAAGSAEPLRFIVLKYQGAGKSDAPVVLVGKGITFDSGGISIKPAAAMDEMKFDMCGAASVLGALKAAAELKLPLNIVGLIPSCENLPDGRALKPGDVITSLSGQTIEVLNTDAEGRLILCDALTYAKRFKPRCVVDMATLTGACVVALGNVNSGLFANDETLAAQLSDAGRAADDPCWRMPLDEDYADALKSNFADVANVGGRAGGAITAAMFLKRFVDYPWAHLDIAGTAWKTGAEKGSTGRPVPLLVHFLMACAAPVRTAATKKGAKAKNRAGGTVAAQRRDRA